VLSGTIVLLAAAGWSAGQQGPWSRFTDILFLGYWPHMGVDQVGSMFYTDEEMRLVDEAMERFLAFEPLSPPPDGRIDEFAMLLEKRQGLERTAVALSGMAVQQAAFEYLEKATIYYEWEGFAEGPLAEAAYAEEYLERTPGSELGPFLTAFLLHRYRAAWECATSAGDQATADAAMTSYRNWFTEAAGSGDPLLEVVARDIDQSDCIYMLEDFPGWSGAGQ
jgi:hypothetical protein